MSPTRVSGAVLGTAIALTSATQLRLAGPVGAGEILLVAWLAAGGLHLALRGEVAGSRLGGGFALFWGAALAAMLLGWMVALQLDVWIPEFARDIVAVLLVAMLCLVLAALPDLEERLGPAALAFALVIAAVSVVLIAVRLMGSETLGPIEAWYGHIRFTGWAENPNQMALALLPIPGLALFVGERLGPWSRRLLRLCTVVALLAGIATLSQALWLAWMGGIGVYLGLRWVERWAGGTGRGGLLRAAAFQIWLPVVVAGLLLVVGDALWSAAMDWVLAGYSEGGQGAGRVQRWVFGFEAWSHSPLVGLGPGAYSGVTGPFQGEEAHHTLIDWTVSTGLFGGVALLLLLGWVAARASAASPAVGMGSVAGLVLFASFHYVIRQPVVWFVLLLLAAMGRRRQPAREDRMVHVREVADAGA